MKYWLAGVVLTFLLLTACQQPPQDVTCEDCNVIFISIDTLRADHTTPYGYEKNTTPNLAEFRQDAVLFNQTIAQAPSTYTSHASIFSSLIPPHHGGFVNRRTWIRENVTMIAEVLNQSGYNTASVNGGGQFRRLGGIEKGFQTWKMNNSFDNFSQIISETKPWIENHSSERMFLFMHTYHVHMPYNPNEEYLRLFEDNYTGNYSNDYNSSTMVKISEGKRAVTKGDGQHFKNLYDAEIREMDEDLGHFLEYLKDKGLYNNSLIIFTSDHGEELGERSKWWGRHGHTLYDELLKVPLLVKFPNSTYQGKIVQDQVRSIDIMPTVLDMVNVTIPQEVEGVSLFKKIIGTDVQLPAFSQRDWTRTGRSIRTEKWKLMYDERLYNLEEDPMERNNLYEERPQVVENLTKLKEAAVKYNVTGKKVNLSEETKKSLKALGYMK